MQALQETVIGKTRVLDKLHDPIKKYKNGTQFTRFYRDNVTDFFRNKWEMYEILCESHQEKSREEEVGDANSTRSLILVQD